MRRGRAATGLVASLALAATDWGGDSGGDSDSGEADGPRLPRSEAGWTPAFARKGYATPQGLFGGKGLQQADTTVDAYAHIQEAFVSGKIASSSRVPTTRGATSWPPPWCWWPSRSPRSSTLSRRTW